MSPNNNNHGYQCAPKGEKALGLRQREMNSDSSLRLSCGSRRDHQHRNVRVMKALPTPEAWLLVKEGNMEKRAPCEVRNRIAKNFITSSEVCLFVDMEIRSQQAIGHHETAVGMFYELHHS